MRDGCITLTCVMLVCVAEAAAVRGLGAGSATTRPPLMGVDTVRADGSPTVFHSGNRSSSPIITASNANEVNVVQLHRVRCAHEISSMQSANMVCSNTASSGVKHVC